MTGWQSEIKDKRLGMLTNQSAFGKDREYHFRWVSHEANLAVLFVPEHGLFAELQDQVSGKNLQYDLGKTEIVNLYGDEESSLVPKESVFQKLDAIIIDIRDVGARYYTFLTSAFYLMQAVAEFQKKANSHKIEFFIIDSPNPIMGKIEGSPLQETYSSFVGVPSVLHCHGLTPAGLLSYYRKEFQLDLQISIIPIGEFHSKDLFSFLWIPPSPNIPTRNTCFVYGGQCLLEGTNLSEGRGTTRPFETFGAPYLKKKGKVELDKRLAEHQPDALLLRPTRFLPTFHKYDGIVCDGFQILLTNPKEFHSLWFTLFFLRQVIELFPGDFAFLDGVYEFRSDRPAIELLVGDPILLDYLNGKHSNEFIWGYLQESEMEWFKKTAEFRSTSENSGLS